MITSVTAVKGSPSSTAFFYPFQIRFYFILLGGGELGLTNSAFFTINHIQSTWQSPKEYSKGGLCASLG